MWLSILRFRVGLERRSGGPRRTETLGRRGGPCVRAGNQSGQALRTAPAFPHGSPPDRSLRIPLGDVDLESGTIGIANTRTMMGNETVVGKILSRWPDSASFPCQFRSGTSSGRSSLSGPRRSWSSDLATLTPATSWWTRWGGSEHQATPPASIRDHGASGATPGAPARRPGVLFHIPRRHGCSGPRVGSVGGRHERPDHQEALRHAGCEGSSWSCHSVGRTAWVRRRHTGRRERL